MEVALEGGCFCRAVRYRARSVFDAGYCHCRICLRTTGSPAHTWFCAREADFELLAGSPRSFRSSEFFTRHFCSTCGVFVYGIDACPPSPKVGSRLVALAIGTLDNPETVQPRIHQWWASRVSWYDHHEELPRIDDGQLPHPESR
jgi:hypothetical protein